MSDLHETQRALARDQIGHLGKNPPLRVETRGQKLDLARSTVEEKRTTEVEIQHEITSSFCLVDFSRNLVSVQSFQIPFLDQEPKQKPTSERAKKKHGRHDHFLDKPVNLFVHHHMVILAEFARLSTNQPGIAHWTRFLFCACLNRKSHNWHFPHRNNAFLSESNLLVSLSRKLSDLNAE